MNLSVTTHYPPKTESREGNFAQASVHQSFCPLGRGGIWWPQVTISSPPASGHHWKPVQTCSFEDLPPLVLTSSGGHQNMYGWQTVSTHQMVQTEYSLDVKMYLFTFKRNIVMSVWTYDLIFEYKSIDIASSMTLPGSL